MSTMSFRVAAGAVLAIAASVSSAGGLVAGSMSPDPVAPSAESPSPRGVGPETALEEVFVYGMAFVADLEQEWLKAGIHEQARAFSERFKASIEIELKELAAPKLELASGPSQPAVGLPPA